jgi:hypothetical protein
LGSPLTLCHITFHPALITLVNANRTVSYRRRTHDGEARLIICRRTHIIARRLGRGEIQTGHPEIRRYQSSKSECERVRRRLVRLPARRRCAGSETLELEKGVKRLIAPYAGLQKK